MLVDINLFNCLRYSHPHSYCPSWLSVVPASSLRDPGLGLLELDDGDEQPGGH